MLHCWKYITIFLSVPYETKAFLDRFETTIIPVDPVCNLTNTLTCTQGCKCPKKSFNPTKIYLLIPFLVPTNKMCNFLVIWFSVTAWILHTDDPMKGLWQKTLWQKSIRESKKNLLIQRIGVKLFLLDYA